MTSSGDFLFEYSRWTSDQPTWANVPINSTLNFRKPTSCVKLHQILKYVLYCKPECPQPFFTSGITNAATVALTGLKAYQWNVFQISFFSQVNVYVLSWFKKKKISLKALNFFTFFFFHSYSVYQNDWQPVCTFRRRGLLYQTDLWETVKTVVTIDYFWQIIHYISSAMASQTFFHTLLAQNSLNSLQWFWY